MEDNAKKILSEEELKQVTGGGVEIGSDVADDVVNPAVVKDNKGALGINGEITPVYDGNEAPAAPAAPAAPGAVM